VGLMDFNSIVLPDFYGGAKDAALFVNHFTTVKPYVRHNVVLRQNLICILLNGTKEVFGSHESIKIDNSEILFMSAGSSIMMHSATDESEKLESLLIFVNDDFLKEFCDKHELDVSARTKTAPSVVRFRKDNFLRDYEISLKLVANEKSTSLQKSKVEELFRYLAAKDRSRKFHGFLRNVLTSTTKKKLRDVVAANCANGLNIEELAFLCNMSLSTFKRHFIKTFHCSPKKYLIDKKMEKAKALLHFSHRPSEIYTELRYQSLSSFSTEFRKHFGVSPRQFQKRITVQ
jgi:AraC family transcriptional regulator, exoenzyme S synthesis regulatory protein ExsA